MKRNHSAIKKFVAVVSLLAMLLVACDTKTPENPTQNPWEEILPGTPVSTGGNKDGQTGFQGATEPVIDIFAGMYKADEEVLGLTPYTGLLVQEGKSGTTSNGGKYSMPVVTGKAAEYANNAIANIYNEILCPNGFSEDFACDVDFAHYGNLIVNAGNYSDVINGVYELYTGQVLTPLEYSSLALFHCGDSQQVLQQLLDWTRESYVRAAMDNEIYTPEGLEYSLEQVENLYFNKHVWIYDTDGNRYYGNPGYYIDYDFRDFFSIRMEKERESGYGMPYLNIDVPGTTTIRENMIKQVKEFDDRNLETATQYEVNYWVAGRYMVFRMQMQENGVTEYAHFFLNMLTGLEESYAQVYSKIGLNKDILNEYIYTYVGADYRNYYEQVSGTPFHWEHNESLYQRTLQQANCDGVRIIPGNCIQIVYNAYVTEDGAPVQREIQLFEHCWMPYIQGVGDKEVDLDLYSGLEAFLCAEYAEAADVGDVRYGAWSCNDLMVVVVGWFDMDMKWVDFKLVCFNIKTGEQTNLSHFLDAAYISMANFREMIYQYFGA